MYRDFTYPTRHLGGGRKAASLFSLHRDYFRVALSAARLLLMGGVILGVPSLFSGAKDPPTGFHRSWSEAGNLLATPAAKAAPPQTKTAYSSAVTRKGLLSAWPDLFKDEKEVVFAQETNSKPADVDRAKLVREISPPDLEETPASTSRKERSSVENLPEPEPQRIVKNTISQGSASGPPAPESTSSLTAKGDSAEKGSAKVAEVRKKGSTTVSETEVKEVKPPESSKPSSAKTKKQRGYVIRAENGSLVVYDPDGNRVMAKKPQQKGTVLKINGKEVRRGDASDETEVVRSESSSDKSGTEKISGKKSGDPPSLIYVTVKKGENLSVIASRYPGITAKKLMEVNQISDPRTLQVGEKIWIPLDFDGVRHKVAPGETLSDLVKEYQIEDLFKVCDVNGLPRTINKLEPGTVLVLPGAKPRPRIHRSGESRVVKRDLSRIRGKVMYTWPVRRGFQVSSLYGLRVDPFQKRKRAAGGSGKRWRKTMHHGIDLAVPVGTPVVAARDGEVIFAGRNGLHGKCVKIRHEDGWVTVYSHNSKLLVRKGDRVKQGEKIALSGNTGRSTGPHVHFEIRRPDQKSVNPKSLLGPAPK